MPVKIAFVIKISIVAEASSTLREMTARAHYKYSIVLLATL